NNTPNPIPASFLRGGTSKGIFLNQSSLPPDRAHWDRIFLGIMGSPDPEHGRQLNGMGGGISSLSKICVVGPPSAAHKAQGVDAEYTFAQVGIRDSGIDYSGNCGNLSSMIGVFAVDEGICAPRPRPGAGTGAHVATVRSFNTNTQKIIDTTFPITDTGPPVAALGLPETTMAGVPGKASTIILDFIDPAGARTGTLLPTGSPVDVLDIHLPDGGAPRTAKVKVSCVDATNPTVFVAHAELAAFLPPLAAYLRGRDEPLVAETLEAIRRAAALKMGLDPAAQAQPKICLLRAPPRTHTQTQAQTETETETGSGTGTGTETETGAGAARGVDIVVHALSMGALHKAVPMTVGLCLGVASNIENTLAWEIVHRSSGKNGGMIRISHPSGVVDVGAEFSGDGTVTGAKVVRTGRRLMKGVVWW
ncbi:PrpF protein, partial [Collybia nuda]